MIHQWEILHYPSNSDPYRYRVSLWSDTQDVNRIRSLFANRTGVVWVPHRKPFTSAFFLYSISTEEKSVLEQILSGNTLSVEFIEQFKKKNEQSPSRVEEDNEISKFDAMVQEESSVSTGLGTSTQESGTIKMGYFVPEYLPDAGDRVHATLEDTLRNKNVSVYFIKRFTICYPSLSLPVMQEFVMKCREEGVSRVVAVGDPSRLTGLIKVGQANSIFIKAISESVIDPNLWLTTIAELLSYE